MEPIVNPWIFYLIDLVDDIICFAGVTCGALLCLCVGFIIWGVMGMSDTVEEDEKKIKFGKKLILPFIISTILLVIAPTSETCYKMLAASYLTPNNITVVGNTAGDIVEFIDNLIDDHMEEDTE